MTPGFPHYTPSSKQGNLGVGIVSRIVDEQFGWLFKRNHEEHDFGIDGQIEVVTETGAVTGQILACQIKCGPSFFRESNKWGYVYRGETKHFNYLANYPIPVIIFICDPHTREAYWVRFMATDARLTDAGWRLTVPYENKLSLSKAAIEKFLCPVTDHLSLLKEYWRVTNMLFESEAILFMIGREEVEAGNLARVEEFRNRITSTKELALHCQGRLEFSFSGYDDDPRELCEVEDVKQYIALLDDAFPELFFFASTTEPMMTIRLFIFCLFGLGWEGEGSQPGKPARWLFDLSLAGPFLSKHFHSLNLICEWLGIPDEKIGRISLAIVEPFGFAPGRRD